MAQNTELKCYQLLAKIRGSLLSKIEHEAKLKTEYCSDDPEQIQKLLRDISDPSKWDYCGLLCKEDKAIMEVIEYLLNDNLCEVRKR